MRVLVRGDSGLPGFIREQQRARGAMAQKIIIPVLLALVLVSCGGGTATVSVNQGTLVVVITDAPTEDFSQINVTVSGVRVHTSADAGTGDEGWHDLMLPDPVKINLLSLQGGIMQTLGQGPLDAGHYQQIRLLLLPNSQESPLNNSVVPLSGPYAGSELPLDTLPEDVNGIKIVHQFAVNEGMTTDLLLDFDGSKSVIASGNGTYMLQPVITASLSEPAQVR